MLKPPLESKFKFSFFELFFDEDKKLSKKLLPLYFVSSCFTKDEIPAVFEDGD